MVINEDCVLSLYNVSLNCSKSAAFTKLLIRAWMARFEKYQQYPCCNTIWLIWLHCLNGCCTILAWNRFISAAVGVKKREVEVRKNKNLDQCTLGPNVPDAFGTDVLSLHKWRFATVWKHCTLRKLWSHTHAHTGITILRASTQMLPNAFSLECAVKC